MKTKQKEPAPALSHFGTREKTRTSTSRRTLAPEASASTIPPLVLVTVSYYTKLVVRHIVGHSGRVITDTEIRNQLFKLRWLFNTGV